MAPPTSPTPPDPDGTSLDPPSAARAFAVYSGLRLALLLVSVAVLLALGVDGLFALGAGVLVSALLSLVLLRPQRDAFTSASIARADRRRAEKADRRTRLDGAGEAQS